MGTGLQVTIANVCEKVAQLFFSNFIHLFSALSYVFLNLKMF